MENEALLNTLKEAFPEMEVVQGFDWPELNIEASQLLSTITRLKEDANWQFDYLFCETCIDWKTHFTMVYHLSSTTHRHSMVLKAKVNREDPKIESVYALYKTADMLEREVFDLFGIQFQNHPDLKRLLLTPEWEGYPLRKDYDDPVNMIRL